MECTPGMIQYYELKKDYSDSILFFRMGDFYEMFDEDAHIANKILGIHITTRNKNATKPIPLAGIPYHAKDKYLPMLIDAGYKVAIAEQVSDPKLKGIVKREVVRVVTPSTVNLEGEHYANKNSINYIIALSENNGRYGISVLESSSGKWETGEIEKRDKLFCEIFKLSPKEVILEKKLFQDKVLQNIFQKKYSLNIYYFDTPKKPREILLRHFHTSSLQGFGIEKKLLAIDASASLLEYLKLNQKSQLLHLRSLQCISFGEFLELDEATIRNLDLIYNLGTKSQTVGTLYGLLDKTKTAMGKRYLKKAIIQPLKNKEAIQKRLDIAEEFRNNIQLLDEVREKLKYIADLENILTRLALGRANPKDLLHLKTSLQSALAGKEIIKTSGNEKLNNLLG